MRRTRRRDRRATALHKSSSERRELREAEMESLKRFINELKEEIARYEARQPVRR